MTLPIIIIGCVLLLLAFVFELIAKRINAPSVILMLLLGWSASQLVTAFNIPIPSLDPVLPVLAP
jgi:Kef-type K+ transport system membrane component KefB